ncbi:virulence factor SrfC family protein [Mesorhizobium sp. BR1-1-3]|uniref:virulence factor SrfC family protein n=1 Tax=unclassified Mesorhizobium TaxID=325217 RepID=UPI000F75A6CD|nr:MULTISPECIES: virulence factor SrfC family protein [unclassified Mesorhizobium]AZO45283.1 virulence factor SrfC-like protein [Mesorhizobium sp. M7D.F.Ca.US.005.01.1.1]MBZ9887583.1 virulence factor SrfC family protein [Mesorhizobium sp. BR1-1-3]
MRKELKKTCDTALKSAQDGLAWIGAAANAERVGSTRLIAEQQLRKSIVATRKAMLAIDRPMCVGVFGPSQAGKSYLVSVLARNGSAPLMARFGDLGREVDFIREINPGGDRESTGLVTRFSVREEPSPAGAPVVLRMLSETDVAKVLGNSFFLDGDAKKRAPLTSDAVLSALEQAKSRARPQAASDGLTEEDVWDLQEYFEKQFAGLANIETLGAYWEEAAFLASRLSIADRADLFSVLWGGLPEFTDLYVELVTALESLGFAKDAYCPVEALVPRESSIIDVETLRGLGKPGQDELLIRPMKGSAVSLPRPVITALVAELRIAISEQPWPFFEHTDLLDFPGARSRQKVDLQAFIEGNPDALKELFVRGKVAYLFDRYVAEQELSSMLLCIKPSNQDVATLPDMIDDWIRTSHGESPLDRARTETALFLVLTMFDMHFSEKAGEEGQSLADRFSARLGASLTRFFGKAHKWPFEWMPDKPFNNSYWLRNPNFKAESLIKYKGGTEIEILPDKVAKVAAMREAYLEVSEVQQHFREPAKAFDEALRLNDGGVSYLAENLAAICRPEIKYGQIRGRVGNIAHDIRRVLAPYFIESDINKRIAERREVSDQILANLTEVWERDHFGTAMKMLQISQNGISEHLHIEYGNRLKRQNAPEEGSEGRAEAAAKKRPTPPRPGAPPLPGKKKVAAAAVSSGGAVSQKALPRETYLARSAIRHWTDSLFALARNDNALQAIGLGQESASELVAELTAAARRSGLEARIAADLAKLSGSSVERSDVLLEKAGFLATSHINRFVSTLGFDAMPENKRPLAPDGTENGEVRVFARRPSVSDCDGLGVERRNFSYLALSEWMYAFHQAVTDNVLSGEGITINVEENERLRAILDVLDDSAPLLATPAGTVR